MDIGQYVASGVVVFSLRTRGMKWVQHLDLSTDHTQYRAFAYSSPTLVDLDRDGRMEIIVGTSMVCVHVGVLWHDAGHPWYVCMLVCCGIICVHDLVAGNWPWVMCLEWNWRMETIVGIFRGRACIVMFCTLGQSSTVSEILVSSLVNDNL